MKNNHLIHQVALTRLEGVGARRAKVLLAYLGSEQKLFDENFKLQTEIPGFAKERFRNLNKSKAVLEAESIVSFVEKNEIETTFFTDKNYPRRLKECADGPMLLFQKGDFDFNPRKTIAIVGTRNMTSYGKQLINELISAIAPYNVQVISGLAYGVDGYTHKKCLENGIPTIGVLGHGLDRIYPNQHMKLAKRMVETKGCGLITEFPHNTKPDRENFPQRNRIVAGMTDATIVIESGERGGSLITALLANDYARDVFAFPGDIDRPFSKGCNRLIADSKAHLITSGKDLIRLMEWQKEDKAKVIQANLFEGLNGDETLIVKAIKEFEKISLDVLSIRLKKPGHVLSGILLGLELRGVVMSLPGKKYALSCL
ncbi:DNA-processing protein DprA [Brumimicrobium oceani]|uniref:DNA-protecting protein DprA n=1 Tax=Brumimicrobium oceani TaxID=2100725 RepID=A0A2U2XD63_9FLAO|nr:DNA-processing protein DprA [Brumimicrobium oceani]PWH85713.1 DNA-protecting protein DprA [Brumimicrobium oceani]